MNHQFPIGISALLALAACSPAIGADDGALSARATIDTTDPRNTPGYVIDSLFTMEEQLARFRIAVGGEVTTLSGGARSLDKLAELFITAAARPDTASLRGLHLTVAEFAWLYFPSSEFAHAPYELPPALLWFQTTAEGVKGITKVIKLFANMAPRATRVGCLDEPVAQQHNRIWRDCVLHWTDPSGKPNSAMLFGAILERDRIFKIISFSNKL
jgi:hypothetical protein